MVAKAYHINSNLYHYAGNNPVKYVDLDGNVIETFWDILFTIIDVAIASEKSLQGDHSGWTDVGVDLASVAIPGLPAGLSKVDDVAKIVKNGDEIADVTKRVFWSGLGKDGANIAEKWAKENGGETLEMYLKREGIDAPNFSDNPDFWDKASKNFAETSSGEVDVLIGPYIRDNSIWNTIEKPILNNNKDVTSINIINPLE